MDIETFDIEHTKLNFTSSEVDDLIKYCHHDIKATYQVYKLILGETENPIYKDNNQIELREQVSQDYGINAINFSDSKIGDEVFKIGYCTRTNIPLKELPKKGTFRKVIKFSEIIPSFINFKTPEFNKLFEKVKKTNLLNTEKFEYTFKYKDLIVTGGEGGIHSTNENQHFVSDNNYTLYTEDVGSYYPAIFVITKVLPKHLKKELLVEYADKYEQRISLKPLAKTDKRIKGKVGTYKLMLNATFGKLNLKESWLYDKKAFLQITIPGQLGLLMLAESLFLIGCRVISMNTDGIEVLVPKDKEKEYLKVKEDWQNLTGFVLEGQIYKEILYSSVNDYIAITEKDVKLKGHFAIDLEYHKNKSKRIIPKALYEYFVNNVKPEDFINKHNDILDFCCRANVNSNFYLENVNSGIKTRYNKIVRYYISKNGGNLYKCKSEKCKTNAAERSEVNSGCKTTILNNVQNISESDYQYHLDNVNKEWYIEECYKIILPIEKGRKLKLLKTSKDQLNLFD